MPWNQGLAGKAFSIAATECKYMRVMAGPGTGNTFAMKRRVARLLEEGSDPERLFVVTFARVAAAGLVKELGLLGSVYSDFSKLGRIHMNGRRGACRLDYLEKASETLSKAMKISLI